MNGQCYICSELFENDDAVNIAEAPCGHTFHEVCLMKWLDTSGTCPSCRRCCHRNQVIRKFFFDVNDEEDPTDQVAAEKTRLIHKVNTELDEMKVELETVGEDMETKIKKDLLLNKGKFIKYKALKKEIGITYEIYKRRIDKIQEEVVRVALGILNQNGEGCTKPLSICCAILKREYEQVKEDQ